MLHLKHSRIVIVLNLFITFISSLHFHSLMGLSHIVLLLLLTIFIYNFSMVPESKLIKQDYKWKDKCIKVQLLMS